MKLPSQTVLYLLDFFQRTSIRKKYNFFLKTSQWNREKIRHYQLRRVKELLIHCQNTVPYYTKLLNKSNFSISEIKSLVDLKYFPCLTRTDIQNNLEELVSVKYSVNNLFRSSSSGTTGIPISYYENKDSSSAAAAASLFAYSLAGWEIGDKTLHIWGNPTSVKHWNKISSRVKRFIKNQTNLASTVFFDSGNHKTIYEKIFASNFKCIDGYTSAIFELAKYINSNNLAKLNADFVFTTAENLTEEQEDIIEHYIGPVNDLYGCGEINGIAIRISKGNKYYIIDPHVYVEVERNDEIYNNIIVTDLDNKAMPFIRYKVGDLVDGVFEPHEDSKMQFSYFKKIFGRELDIIELPGGKKILPVNIVGGTLFRKIGGIKKHKVVWDKKELIFYFETTNDFNLEIANRIINKEFSLYNIPMKIIIVEKLLPDKNGKFKYFEKVN